MLATPSTPASGRREGLSYPELIRSGRWLGDTKLDGIRAYALWDGHRLKLTGRTGAALTSKFPELHDMLADFAGESVWLDGEIVAYDGRFETVLTREKQEMGPAIRRLSQTHPCRFVAFDIPEFADDAYIDRRSMLEDLLAGVHGPSLGLSVVSDDPSFLAMTRDLGMEGVIAKRLDSKYEFGKRSKAWVKFKNTYRVSCLVAGYTAGSGHREQTFGALELALVDEEGQVVSCGRVGTGFSEREITELKARLDSGEVIVAEIEALNRTSGNVLRFPVYRGTRRDVEPLDCSVRQLEELPLC